MAIANGSLAAFLYCPCARWASKTYAKYYAVVLTLLKIWLLTNSSDSFTNLEFQIYNYFDE